MNEDADRQKPIETVEDFDRAMAELLSRTSADVISEATRLRDEASFAKARSRSYRYFGAQAEADAEADRMLAQAAEDEQNPNAEIRRLIALADPDHPYTPGQPLETIQDVNAAIAHALMQSEPEPRPLTAAEEQRRQERIEQSRERMQQRWGTRRVDEDTPLDALLLETFGSREVADAWLLAPNPVLAGETPASYLQRGDETAVRKLLIMSSTGMPT